MTLTLFFFFFFFKDPASTEIYPLSLPDALPISQRGYNIESLTVARTYDPELSRMTIVVDVDPALRQQVIKQMNRLINVLQATDLTDLPAVVRELVQIGRE